MEYCASSMGRALPTLGTVRCLAAHWAVAATIASISACGDDTAPASESAAGPSDQFYAAGRRLEIEIELPPADWDVLREEGFSLFEFQRGEASDFDYTFFEASVSIDGQRVERASVRKKGGLGSLSRSKPSLIIDFDRILSDQSILGVTRLTLNNDRSNPSHSRQCMAYELYTRAGLPASRCNLAHVVVNGQDLGTFSNVEPVRKPLLRRLFGDDSGNLYEGREDGDFTPLGIERMQVKTNETSDRSDLGAVVRALEADDAVVVERLEAVLDLDRFRRFWALETLTGNWDSYSGNTNNFYVYHDPTSDRLVFLPWGTDTAFTGGSIVDSYNQTLTVYATGALANRLYNLPDERARFRALLGELNDTLWNTAELEARLDELAALSTDAWPGAVRAQREFLRTHSGALRAELELPAPEWRLGGIDLSDPCRGRISAVSGQFETTFTRGPLEPDPRAAGAFQADMTIDGQTLDAQWVGVAGRDTAGPDPSVAVQLIGAMADGRALFIGLSMPPGAFSPGVQPFYNFETVGFAAFVSPAQPDGLLLGFVSEGAIEFSAAGLAAGDRVAGHFEGELFQTNCFE
jgi:hypothetical protein